MGTTVLFMLLGPWTGFFLGILHTIMPCEDKAVFLFYAFGVSRDWKKAFRILNLYALGLFCSIFTIGGFVSYIASKFGQVGLMNVDPSVWNLLSCVFLIIAGAIMLFQIFRRTYWPHSDQYQEIGESLSTLKSKKRTGFLLGILAGIPPCIFEYAVYTQAVVFSIQSGHWGDGMWIIIFFGIGTWIGLFVLTIIISASGQLAKLFRQSSIQRAFRHQKKSEQESKNLKPENENKIEDNNKDTVEEVNNQKPIVRTIPLSKIEIISGFALIFLGIVFLILTIFHVPLLTIEIPNVPPVG